MKSGQLVRVVLVLAVLQLGLAQQQADDRVRRRCGQGEATCGDGRCIDYRRLCDGRVDCVDGSDEASCGTNRCQPNELQCANGKCTMKHWRCDGDNDCGDNTDEQNCEQRAPGSQCSISEFQCADRLQCILRSFHCDGQNDCLDGSDENGCAAPVIVERPPAVNVISIGGVFVIRCRAVGTPIPEISWRRNWRHVPEKCRQESLEGRGTLTCPDAAASDQGAYSCEAINTRGVVFAIPDTNVVVTNGGICQSPDFNSAALTNADCQRCFCFGASAECASSSLFVSELPAPDPSGFSFRGLDRLPSTQNEWRTTRLRERPYPGQPGEVQVRSPQLFDSEAYFGLPSSHTGQQLNSYGGYLRFNLQPVPPADDMPEVVIQGNGVTLWYRAGVKPAGGNYIIKVAEGSFFSSSRREQSPQLASREEIMMALQNVENFFIRAPPSPQRGTNVVLSGVRMDTAIRSQTSQGPAALVEQCRCPPGYTGLSCEECAAGYDRRPSSQRLSLGTCESRLRPPPPPPPPPAPEQCRDGEYGDPGRNIPCRSCPCPGPQQYGRTCFLATDDQVTCNCAPGYAGRRCRRCAAGYRGDPSRGQPCQRGGECDPAGSLEDDPDPRTGQCNCKEFVTGRRCDRCVPRAFYLSSSNQYGCINCFCSGVTDQCTSSQWYRQQETAVFVSDAQDITLTDDILEQSFEGVSVDRRDKQLVFKNLDRLGDKPAYWSLPARFLGDKVTAYGGYLRINMSFSAPRGAESFPDYPDIEIFGNDVRLGHLVSGGLEANRPVSLSVPLLEEAWRRDDGGPVDREHLLMALADLEYIIFKAADARGATEAKLSGLELDIATQRFTGQEPAHAVEQCSCPQGYRGLSCEDCDVGYTRSLAGLYLRSCVQCSCGGRSDECDPETGECVNCRENTAGPECGACRAGYEGDPIRGQPCRPGADLPCVCDPLGSRSDACDARRQCDCKANVEGNHCDRCRSGTFGLGTNPAAGCSSCFCSGVSQQCSVAQLYRSQLPMSVLDSQHGVTLTNSEGITVVENGVIAYDAADNEVSYSTTTSSEGAETLYWSLPDLFTGDQLRSYGGSLMIRQRLQLRSRAGARPDTLPDIILYGAATELRLRTPSRPQPDGRLHTYSVQLTPDEGWVDGDTGALADRSLLMTVLGDVEAILIRATLQLDDGQQYSYLSNVVLDTAIATSTGDDLVETIEQCRCPAGFQGLSCQECAPGHYRAADDSCQPCLCSGNEQSCELDDAGDVTCDCRPSYSGRRCEIEDFTPGGQSPAGGRGDQPPPGGRSRDNRPPPGGRSRDDRPPGGRRQEARRPPGARSRDNRPPPGGRSRDDRPPPGGRSRDDRPPPGGRSRDDRPPPGDRSRDDRPPPGDRSRDDRRLVRGGSGDESAASAPSVTISPRYLQLEAGQPAELLCEAGGSPAPDIVWSGGRDNLLEPDVTIIAGLMGISAVQKVHEAEYTCTATNAAGTDSVRTIIYVSGGRLPPSETATPTGRREDQQPPSRPRPQGAGQQLQMTVYPAQEQQVPVGGSVLIQCRAADGYPQSDSVVWSRADGRAISASAEPQSEGGVLRFIDVTGDEEGDYVCTASDGASEVTIIASIDVQSAPVIQLSQPATHRVVEGQRVELTCSASGDPTPSVSWSDGGWSSIQAVVGRVTGVFSAVTPANAGVYTCTAENAVGRVVERLQLLVTPAAAPAPAQRSRQAAAGRPAEFAPVRLSSGAVRTGRDVYEVPLNGRAELRCFVEGANSPVMLTWMRSGGLPMPADHSIRSGTLYINAVQKEAEGVYTCLGIGGPGVVLFRADATLRVLAGAGIVAFERDVRAYIGSSVTLRCDSSGFDGRVSWSRRDGRLLDRGVADDNSLTLMDVAESASGVYMCSVQDQTGRTAQDSIFLTVEPPLEPVTCPPDTLPCRSGECLPFKYFCDGATNCIDGSDETLCNVQSDQPASPPTEALFAEAEMAPAAPLALDDDGTAKKPIVD